MYDFTFLHTCSLSNGPILKKVSVQAVFTPAISDFPNIRAGTG